MTAALRQYQESTDALRRIAEMVRASEPEVIEHIEKLIASERTQSRQVDHLKEKLAHSETGVLESKARLVKDVKVLGREARGPLLTGDVPEVGTDRSSVMQPGFDSLRKQFEQNYPTFSWGEFEARAGLIFAELQAAWSTLNWERARPHETDNIFQMHQYWIDAYRRQGLRNALDNCKIIAMQPMKIKEDAFYNAITLRIWAEGNDYTVDRKGKVVAGSQKQLRRWSEYWTFIRNRGAGDRPVRVDLNCPNCGAPLKVNATGVCEFCGGKITSGDFDWVLSKIEQDESYAG